MTLAGANTPFRPRVSAEAFAWRTCTERLPSWLGLPRFHRDRDAAHRRAPVPAELEGWANGDTGKRGHPALLEIPRFAWYRTVH